MGASLRETGSRARTEPFGLGPSGFDPARGGKRPFVQTHRRRKDGLSAMLLSTRGGEALYRVQWFDNDKRHENTLTRPETAFNELFARVSA